MSAQQHCPDLPQVSVTGAAFLFASIAIAKRPVPSPTPAPTAADLTVSFEAVGPVRVYDVASYTVRVTNLGGSAAAGSVLKIQLPVTMNSPSQRIMGTLSSLPLGCSVSGTLLSCSLGSINAASTATRSFNFALPHAEKGIELWRDRNDHFCGCECAK